jgi:hypothetical protein
MRGYTKADVDMHSDGFGQWRQPAVKVKVGAYPGVDQVTGRFGCSEGTAEKALQYAFASAAETFWQETAPELAERYFGECCVYSEGRSGGWLVLAPKLRDGLVTGRPLLPAVEDWDGSMLNRWACFERAVRAEVDYMCSWEWVEGMISANEWAVDQTAIEGMIETALA